MEKKESYIDRMVRRKTEWFNRSKLKIVRDMRG